MKQIHGCFLTQSNKNFPADCEMLDHMQTNLHVVSVLGNIGGDKTILHGCEPQEGGTRRAPGYLFLRTAEHPEGEVLYWEGGTVASGMYLRREPLGVEAQGYAYPEAYVGRSLAPGIGAENYDWADFAEARTLPVLEAEIARLRAELADVRPAPPGIVEMWAGRTVPEGYELCEGQPLRIADYPALHAALGDTFNESCGADGRPLATAEGYFRLPDLRSRFIVGCNPGDDEYKRCGLTGGTKQHRLTVDELPAHTHGQHLWKEDSGRWKSGGNNSSPRSTSVHDQTVPFGETSSTGGGAPHENRPPYYVLAYIMKTK